jgi:hypothetical protein
MAKSFWKSTKGAMTLGEVPTVALTFVLIAAIFVSGFLVVAGLGTGLQVNSAAANSTTLVTTGLSNIVSYAPTWGTIVGVSILLGIVIVGFGMARQKGYM